MNDDLLFLIKWRDDHCDGDWEHCWGIRIGTIDNPGWFLNVYLNETELENQNFNPVEIERSENDWLDCRVRKNVFEGNGGPFNLPEILRIFREWAETFQENNDYE